MTIDDKKIGAGAGGLAPGDPGGAALAAAQALVAAYDPACQVPLQSGTAFYNAVHNFKVAYNIWTSGTTDGPNQDGSPCAGCLAHNGLYDQACVDAINGIPGAPAAPAACTKAAPPPPPVKTCPAGQHLDSSGNCVPDAVASTGWPTWLKVVLWIIVIGGVAGLGLWLYKHFGKSSPASSAAEPKRKGKRKAGR